MSLNKAIPGFDIVETIQQTSKSAVYRALKLDIDENVVLKLTSNTHPSPEEIARLTNEYKTLKAIDSTNVVSVLGIVEHNNAPIVVEKDIGGISLAKLYHTSQPTLESFLDISIKLTQALEDVHRQGWMHKDINPSNVVLNPKTQELRLIDFGLSSRLNFEHSSALHPNIIEGTLEYMSPEQTGRMNRSTDYRTDFYSLGITFFKLLTGALPFVSEDKMEMIHFHLARSMPPAESVQSSIPKALYQIILKLTAKDAEDRYQSASGIKEDLLLCLSQLKKKGSIDEFELGTKERLERFLIPEKLYGREREVKTLLRAFKQVEGGDQRLLLIKGFSGIGKTALINEINKPITRNNGYFISGKFDQYRRLPYEGFASAFAELARYLLSENKERIESVKAKLKERLGLNLGVVLYFIPEFEFVLGKHPKPQNLNPEESERRFLFAFREFIRAFAAQDHPLVIFLDDLQWADESSLRLIKELAISEIGHLLIVGAYRDNEVHDAHALSINISEVKKHVQVDEIELEGLKEEDINQMLSDTLLVPAEASKDLASLVYNRTGGNPFFLNEILNSFYKRGFLKFNDKENNWHWSQIDIEQHEVSDNVADYILNNLGLLPKSCTDILEIAACIGGTFKLKMLELITGLTASDVFKLIWPAVESDILLPLSDNYRLIYENEDFGVNFRFQHDRIQQVVYNRKSEDERKQIHLSLGEILLANHENLKDDSKNEIIRHLNLAKDLIKDQEKRSQLARLNLTSGKRALDAIANQAAYQNFSTGIELLPTNNWEKEFELSFELYKGYAQSAYQIQAYDSSEKAFEILLKNARTKLEQVEVLGMKLRQYTTLGKTEEAIREGILGLKILGISLAERPNAITVLKAVLKAKWSLRNTSTEKLLEMPEMKDAEKKAAARLLSEIAPSAYILGNDNLYGLTQLKLVDLSVKYGNTPESAFAYIAYGTVLSEAFGDLAAQESFGQLALKLNEKQLDVEYRCRVISAYGVLIHHFNNHWNTTTDWFKKGVQAGYLSADLFFLAYSAGNCHVSDADQDLEERIKGQEKYLKVIKETGYQDAYEAALLNIQYLKCLAGLTESATSMNDDKFSEEKSLEKIVELKFKSGLGFYHIHKASLFFYENKFESALEHLDKAKEYLVSMTSLIGVTNYHMLSGLVCAGAYKNNASTSKNKLKKRLALAVKKFEKWANYNPTNFKHKLCLLKAELALINDQPKEATYNYRLAIKYANEYGWPIDEALANELYANYHLKSGDDRAAVGYVTEASFLYAKMGLKTKVDMLKKDFSAFIPQFSAEFSTAQSSTFTLSTHSTSKEIDFTSIVKASQAISEEIKLEALLDKVMRIIIQNAGAENAYLILDSHDGFMIQASAAGQQINSIQRIPLAGSNLVPTSVVNYVINSAKPLLLHNAIENAPYSNDKYIQAHKTKSVLCCPILLFGELFGIVYLENNISTRAFTEDRLRILTLLSSQMAISIQNAFLYANLEEQVSERTIELSQEKEKSDTLLHNILPEEIAIELKTKGESRARLYENVSVMFTDFAQFTELGLNLTPNELVSHLDLFFSMFDRINLKYGVEKIKTIGDAYMAAGGLPIPSKNSVKNTILAALEMQQFVEDKRREFMQNGKPAFNMRVGIHTGQLIAGIVGLRKFQYDIWGDTVNTASRMESSGEVGRVNISHATYELLKDDLDFAFDSRGKIEVKGKGEMEMWFVSIKK